VEDGTSDLILPIHHGASMKNERRLTKEDYDRVQEIMEILRPKEWLERQPRFSEEYLKVAIMAEKIYREREEKKN
jgi:hypothetical protein